MSQATQETQEVDYFSEVTDEPVTVAELQNQGEIPFDTGADTVAPSDAGPVPSVQTDAVAERDGQQPAGNVGEPVVGENPRVVTKIEVSPGVFLDPDTGEVLERPYALQRLGWSAVPTLSNLPTSAEIDSFQRQIDKVVDIICTYEDRIARYTAEHDYRIAKLEGAKTFWQQFVEPYARELGNKTLKRFRKGEKQGQFSEKTIHLPSGQIAFKVKGGWTIFDFQEVKKHLETLPVKDLGQYCARPAVEVDYPKFASLVRKGVFTALPGTQYTEPEPLGTIKVKSPRLKGKSDEDSDDS